MGELLLSLMLFTFASGAFASTYNLKINNTSDEKVSFGIFKGIPIPSLCEDGPCMEERFIKFRALPGAKKIKGVKVISLDSSDFENEQYFLMVGDRQIEFASCETLDQDQQYFYPPVGTQVNVSKSEKRSYCIDELDTEIIVE